MPPVLTSQANEHYRAVVKRTTEIAKWCKLIAALGVCASIACSEQIVPQLIAQLASLDHDHGISLHASGDGVYLILTHDHN
jgi:sulfite reductase beta subunit-like hemoprotein